MPNTHAIQNRLVAAMQNNQDFILRLATVRLDLIIMRLQMPEVYAHYLSNLERCLDQIFDLLPDRIIRHEE